MQTPFIMSRLGGTAIAAVLALYATPALAQEATPQEAPQISVPQETPAPTATTPDVTPDPLAAQPAVEETPVAIETTAAPAGKKASATPKASAKASPKVASTAKVSAPAVAVAPAASAPVAQLAEDPLAATEATAPVAPLAAEAPPAPAAEPAQVASGDDTVPIALGAGLGLLALGGAAFALRRRRREDVEDDVILSEPTIARRPAATVAPEPVMGERSAFAWGVPAAAAATASPTASKNWIERAHQGPTPENPFLSLKKRLQRAAFYDQRERAVAAGRAKPLSPMAGLPKRFAEALRPKTSAPSYGFSYVPA